MPLYEYQCDACGTRVEKIQKFSDPVLETCEACGGKLQKLISSPAIQFKGSGWYITDYAKKTAVEGTAAAGAGTSAKSGDAAKTADSASSSTTSATPAGGGTDSKN